MNFSNSLSIFTWQCCALYTGEAGIFNFSSTAVYRDFSLLRFVATLENYSRTTVWAGFSTFTITWFDISDELSFEKQSIELLETPWVVPCGIKVLSMTYNSIEELTHDAQTWLNTIRVSFSKKVKLIGSNSVQNSEKRN